jgi:hypothetical protein
MYYGVIEVRDTEELEDPQAHFGGSTAESVGVWFDEWTPGQENSFTHCYLLPIRVEVGGHWSNWLVLEPAGVERGQYQKIGYYRAYHGSEFSQAAQELDSTARGWIHHSGEVLEDQEGIKQYFIDII